MPHHLRGELRCHSAEVARRPGYRHSRDPRAHQRRGARDRSGRSRARRRPGGDRLPRPRLSAVRGGLGADPGAAAAPVRAPLPARRQAPPLARPARRRRGRGEPARGRVLGDGGLDLRRSRAPGRPAPLGARTGRSGSTWSASSASGARRPSRRACGRRFRERNPRRRHRDAHRVSRRWRGSAQTLRATFTNYRRSANIAAVREREFCGNWPPSGRSKGKANT